jgi:hypothetical protein
MRKTMASTPPIRNLLAFLSACCIAASVLAYIWSFFGAPVDAIFPWEIPLMLGAIAQILPVYVLEYPASRAWFSFWKELVRDMPTWVAPCAKILLLNFVAHLAWFALHSRWGVPEILDGQYVLAARGHVLKVISQAEYLTLSEAELRTFSALLIYFYFMHMTYWWYRRKSFEPSAPM